MPKFIVLSGKKQAGKTTCANFIKTYLEKQYITTKKLKVSKSAKEEWDETGVMTLPGLIGRPTNLIKITSFASPIKEFCLNVIGLSEKQIYGTDEQKNSDTHIKWDTMPDEIQKRYDYPHRLKTIRRSLGSKIDLPLPSKFMTAREVMQIFGTDVMRTFFDYDIWAKAPFQKDYGTTQVIIIDDCRFPNEADMALKNDAILIRLGRNRLHDTHASEIAMDDYDTHNYTYTIENQNISLEELEIITGRLMDHSGLMQ